MTKKKIRLHTTHNSILIGFLAVEKSERMREANEMGNLGG